MGGDGFQLSRVELEQGRRHFHPRALEQVDELQGVGDGLAAEVVVGDDES